jgi:transposase InsO family protein
VTLHRNARTCPRSRKLLVDRVISDRWSIGEAAAAAGVSERTASKWLKRFREEGEGGLADRSSAPRRVPNRTAPERVEAILALRELRFTAAEIAETLGMAHSTASAVLKRHGKGRLPRPDADQPENRYERARPGELVHIDVKKLGRVAGVGHRITGERRKGGGHARGAGWEFVHVCIDDCTRLAYAEALDSERADTVCGFLERAIDWFAGHGIHVERVMTDNGAGYRSLAHRAVCRRLGLKHLFTEPYRPRTNGKAERFIKTMTERWAYGGVYRTNSQRRAALPGFLDHYNYRRPHRSLDRQPPIQRLAERNNLTGTYT